jgi:hypothetical protein
MQSGLGVFERTNHHNVGNWQPAHNAAARMARINDNLWRFIFDDAPARECISHTKTSIV